MKEIFILEDQTKGLELIENIIQQVFGTETCIQHKSSIGEVTIEDISQCDLAFIDLRLPDGFSFDFISNFKQINTIAPAIVTTLYEDDDMVFSALKSGADGYLLKSDGPKRLVQCLNRILEGEPLISPEIARKLMKSFAQVRSVVPENSMQNAMAQDNDTVTDSKDEKILNQLTKRENQVLSLISQGLVSREIADEIFLSVHTINGIIKSIYRKLNINSRYQAIAFAKKVGVA